MPRFLLLFSDDLNKLKHFNAEAIEEAESMGEALSWIASRAHWYKYVKVVRLYKGSRRTVFIAQLDDLADTLDDLFKEWAFDNGCRCPE